MIIDIIEALNHEAIFRPTNGNGYALIEMIEQAFPNERFYLVCAGGYENALMFENCSFVSQV